MNYKELLTKYINHVGENEGVDFIPKNIGEKNPFGREYTAQGFTQEELEALWDCTGWDEEKGEYKKETE